MSIVADYEYSNHLRLDVVAFIQRLKKANFTQEQSELLARELSQERDSVLEVTNKNSEKLKAEIKQELHADELVTKSDLKQQLEIVKLELQKEISELRYATLRFVIWTGTGVSVVVLGGMFTMLKLMLHVN